MKINCILIMAIMLFVSCAKKEDLKLTFLNDSLVSYVPQDSIHYRITLEKEQYEKIANNIIQFKIENISNQTYILIFDDTYRYSYPNDFMSIGFHNFLFTDSDGNPLDYSSTTAEGEELFYDNLNYQDRSQIIFYNNIGYKNKSDTWKRISSRISKNTFVIHSNETLYFETYTPLPQKKDPLRGDYTQVNFDYNREYIAKLKFDFQDYEKIDEFLTDIKKKEINENNYKIYSGTLESINSVPVNFVKK